MMLELKLYRFGTATDTLLRVGVHVAPTLRVGVHVAPVTFNLQKAGELWNNLRF